MSKPDWIQECLKVELPPELDTEEFREAMELWFEWKQESKESYKPIGWKIQLKRLARMGSERAVAAIEFSGGRWAGIFEERQGNGPAVVAKVSATERKRQREQELKERLKRNCQGITSVKRFA